MEYTEALDFLNNTSWFASAPGTARVAELLEKLGNPQKGLKFVHIAGTNGKGSCAAMTAAVLKACGYRTGLYTSPYLYRFNERMQINGKQIENDALCAVVEKVKPLAEAMEEKPTAFERMTACALQWFSEEKCDIVVLEVGLGGLYDATNVIDSPEVSVIMNIGLDHTELLGDTPEKIAVEKAGIIKKGCPCVLYEQSESVMEVIRARCAELDAPLTVADFSRIRSEWDTLEGQVFSYRDEPYAIPLLGGHQLKNAAVVLDAVSVLRSRGWKLEQSDVEHGLYSVSWPGRFELLSDEPYFVVDGGHNPQCAVTVAENLVKYFPDSYRVLLVGVLADKDYTSLLDILAPAADEFVCITPSNRRALPAEELAKALEKYGKLTTVCDSIPDGVAAAQDAARENDGMVCAVGSLYSVGEIRACYNLF